MQPIRMASHNCYYIPVDFEVLLPPIDKVKVFEVLLRYAKDNRAPRDPCRRRGPKRVVRPRSIILLR